MVNAEKKFDTVIVGLGKTGMSCIRYLKNKGENFAVVDSRSCPAELKNFQTLYSDVPLFLGPFSEDILCSAYRLLISPGIALTEPSIKNAVDKGVHITSDIELFHQEVSAPIIGITGSNGKSTVASLVNDMICRAGKTSVLAGNIGTPVLDIVQSEQPDFYVLELSSFQLEMINSLNTVASVVLNITEDHMDRYSTIKDYISAKKKIYTGNGVMVINLDDKNIAHFDKGGRNSICYTLNTPDTGQFGVQTVRNKRMLAYGEKALLAVSELHIKGDHNISNVLAALSLGSAVNLPMHAMLDALTNFHGLPHRCQRVARINNVNWYNDSKATNVAASCAAIKTLAATSDNCNLILIAGGLSKGADFSDLSEIIKEYIDAVILIGQDAELLAEKFKDKCSIYFESTIDTAVATAASIAREGDTVLLSPACASTDMFSNYEERGNFYIEAIHRLEGKN